MLQWLKAEQGGRKLSKANKSADRVQKAMEKMLMCRMVLGRQQAKEKRLRRHQAEEINAGRPC